MKTIIMFLIILGAFPFLFPNECRYWTQVLLKWLDKKERIWEQEEAERRAAAIDALDLVSRNLVLIRRKLTATKREIQKRNNLYKEKGQSDAIWKKYHSVNQKYEMLKKQYLEAKNKQSPRY